MRRTTCSYVSGPVINQTEAKHMTKVILKIENDEPFSVSLEDLLDGELEADEAHIRSRLAQCGVYYGGGGAGVRFRIRPPTPPRLGYVHVDKRRLVYGTI